MATASMFAIPADGSTFTVLHPFTGADGARPVAELMVASSGKLYGVTSSGGVNSAGATTTLGTIFSIDRAGTEFRASLQLRRQGRLGAVEQTARDGARRCSSASTAGTGNCGYGTIFRYSLAGDTVTGNTSCGQKKKQQWRRLGRLCGAAAVRRARPAEASRGLIRRNKRRGSR